MKQSVERMIHRIPYLTAALLAFMSLGAAAQNVKSVNTFVVWPGSVAAAPALDAAQDLASMEHFCQGTLCVALPRTAAEHAALLALETHGFVSLEALPDAHKIVFAKATYDADTDSFDADFPGRTELDTVSAMSQWSVIFKAFPDPAWRKDIEGAGFHLGEPMGAMAYQLYGPRDSLASLRARAPYIAALAEVPHGIKRFDVDIPRPGDEAGGPAPTTVVIFDVPDSPAHAALVTKAGAEPPVVFTTGATVAYHATLTRDEGLYLSTFPEVIAVERQTARAVPSDERSNRIVAGDAQSPGSSWPLSLGENSNPPYWDDYLSFLSSLGINPANQTIAFLDTGLNAAAMQACPPALVDPSSGICSIVNYNPNDHYAASITDITTDFPGSATRATDYLGHGTLTTSVAAGFAAATGTRDTQGYSFPQGIAPGAKIALAKILEDLGCGHQGETYRNEFVGDVPDHVESGMKDGSLRKAENGCTKRPLSGKGAAREDQNRNDPWSARAG